MNTRPLLFAFLLLSSAAMPSCTPKVGKDVPLEDLLTAASLHGAYVATTGELRVSAGLMGSTSCDATRCKLKLRGADPGKEITIEVTVGDGENEMAPLPEKYSKADLKVMGMGGKPFADGDSLKVSGTVRCRGNNGEERLPCSIYAERLDAL
jgi:hypothetical protein